MKLQTRIHEHKEKGGKAAATQCDVPGGEASGPKVSFGHVMFGHSDDAVWLMEGNRVSHEILCEGLRRQQARILGPKEPVMMEVTGWPRAMCRQ